MGILHQGVWQEEDSFPTDEKGAFVRQSSSFRHQISSDDPKFQPEAERYHLYVSYACPWAHRTLIMRALKGLEPIIGVSVVHPHMLKNGWTFANNFPEASADSINNCQFVYELYIKAKPDYTGRATVPILWDKKTNTIVNNESSEILRIFNSAFQEFSSNKTDYFPKQLALEIEELNELIYNNLNNGVYRAGFAKSQEAYEDAVNAVFQTLDILENRLEKQAFLFGDEITESDIRLFPTLVRFDPVYHYHFKCNLRKIADYPNLSAYLKILSKLSAFRDTTNIMHIKAHYYYSHESLNPYRLVPLGPLS